jgi:hypothetical protein
MMFRLGVLTIAPAWLFAMLHPSICGVHCPVVNFVNWRNIPIALKMPWAGV